MKIAFNQLEQHVTKKLAPLYVLSGDEILLQQEAVDVIRAQARQAGFIERISIQVEPQGDWAKRLQTEMNSLSLFSSKRIIELHLGSTKPNAAATKLLKEILSKPIIDTVLLITTAKLDSKTEQSAWFKAVDQCGVTVTLWPIPLDQLPQWIIQRAKKSGITILPDAAKFLAEQVEGNLLAAAQEIEKLTLLQSTTTIDIHAIAEMVTDNARFDIFNLVECALSGNAQRCLRILTNLQAEGTEPLLVLWALTRELRTLTELSKQLKQGATLGSLFSKYRIWEKRQAGVRRFLQQHNQGSCWQLLTQSSYIDRLIKGSAKGNAWIALQQLTLHMAGNAIMSVSAQ